MRIFIALDIDPMIRTQIGFFMEGVQDSAPDVRWVKPESWHVTLKFIGEQSVEMVEKIRQALAQVEAAPFEINSQGYGFFPTPKSARVFWVGIEAGPQLASLAAAIENAVATLGISREDRSFNPHLTLARSGSAAPGRKKHDRANLRFERLQQKLAAMSPPDFGTMTAREFYLYESKLSRDGSLYTKLAAFALKL